MTKRDTKHEEINAMPTKNLFIDILTRDVSIKDCIFDLIDNSVDAYIRHELKDRRKLKLHISKVEFVIHDNCGGIEYNFLKNNVFRFGVETLERDKPTLGIYGIGMKRAMLKIGKKIDMETDDGKKYCKISFDLDKWVSHDRWKIPFEEVSDSKLSGDDKGYTKISITNLHKQVQEKFNLESFIKTIEDFIHITYTHFISNNIDFSLNGQKIVPYEITVRYDEKYKPTKIRESIGDVNVEIICFIDPRIKRTERELGKRGWNVFCNRRLILVDDTTPTTGWTGNRGELPKYHSIYNEFRGIVFIQSDDPSKLPINTAKNDLNTESPVYHGILNLMINTARPLITYISKKYPKEKNELDEIEEKMEDIEKEVTEKGKAEEIQFVPVDKIEEGSVFVAPKKREPKIKIVTITYTKPEKLVKKIKKYLGVKSNKEVGETTFEYFIDTEDIKDD